MIFEDSERSGEKQAKSISEKEKRLGDGKKATGERQGWGTLAASRLGVAVCVDVSGGVE